MPDRIQRRRTKGWRMPAGAVYVGRPSKWGNPFHIHHGHTLVGPPWSVARDTWWHIPADECTAAYVTSSQPLGTSSAVATFRQLVEVRLRDEPERARGWLAPLAGKDLACWCPLDQPCHADVLLELANAMERAR